MVEMARLTATVEALVARLLGAVVSAVLGVLAVLLELSLAVVAVVALGPTTMALMLIPSVAVQAEEEADSAKGKEMEEAVVSTRGVVDTFILHLGPLAETSAWED